MSELSPDQYAKLQAVYLRAIQLPTQNRDAFAAEEFGDDAMLMEAFLALGDQADIPTAFLDPLAEEGVAGFAFDESKWHDPARIGPSVGRYRLLSLLGEGGFGMVYEAEQTEPVRRRVAVKIVKPGQDSRAVLNRFEAERQALARMDHAFIAKIFDGGSTGPESGHQGLPYFAMELVRGEPITTFCDRERLTIAQRLELMKGVCDAVDHAHKNRIIHRDIKPGNVLVAYKDRVPTPKIIDFGIAKAIGVGLTENTIVTHRGQLIGTPAYMSPEQAEMSGVEIDARSDVYSLGVLLYEVLTSRPPFDPRTLRSAGHAEMVRIIREVSPQRPSTRLETRGHSHEDHDEALEIARARRAELHELTRQLRTDLDWVVMKCLEKERDRRYASAGELGDELRRILNHEPVLAGPPSLRYRTRKYLRRHRASLTWVTVLLFVVAVFASISVAQWVRAENLARQLRGGGAMATAFSADLNIKVPELDSNFDSVTPVPLPGSYEPEDEEQIRVLLERLSSEQALSDQQRDLGYATISRQLANLIEKSTPRSTSNKILMAQVLVLHAEIVQSLRRPGPSDTALARKGFRRALEIAGPLAVSQAQIVPLVIHAHRGLGDTLRQTDTSAAEREYQQAQELIEVTARNANLEPAQLQRTQRPLIQAERDLGLMLARQCKLADSERLIAMSVQLRRKNAAGTFDRIIDELSARRDLAVGLSTLAELRAMQYRLPEAERAAQESFEIRQAILHDALEGSAQLHDEIGEVGASRAMRSFRRDVESLRLILADINTERGKYEAASQLLVQADQGLEKLHLEQEEDARIVRDRVMLALQVVANRVRAEQVDAALEMSQQASDRLEQLAKAAPNDARLSELRARWSFWDGEALRLGGQQESILSLKQAVTMYEQLALSDPARMEFARMLARALGGLARARLDLQPENDQARVAAEAEFIRALDLLEHGNNDGPVCGVSDIELNVLREGIKHARQED
jgi:serine/threonine protein kinase